MLFPTATFALFFLVVLPASWLLMRDQPRWRVFILVASYFFYGWWDWRFVFLIAGSTLLNQGAALALARVEEQNRRKAILAGTVTANLAALGFFKYYGFFLSSAANVSNTFGLDWAPDILAITLPVGISFFTFQALSYVIDVYRRRVEPTTLPKFAVYLSFFPQFVAGPIVRASEFLPQLASPRDARRIDASRAFLLIASGLFLKVVVANHLAANIVDGVFGAPEQHSSLEVLVGIYGYSAQIFADFCGYTNIAIGLAMLLGFRFPQNFDNPYAATSLRDFWRRWHMTLSRWLRDYLYVPLGGNRGSRAETYRNLMLVMLIGGLWHGAAWTFVVWGGIHGVGLAIERFWWERRAAAGKAEPADTRRRRIMARLATFHVVTLAWVFFRSDSFGAAADILERLVSAWGQASPAVSAGVVAAILVTVGAQYIPKDAMGRLMAGFSRLHPVTQGLSLAATMMVMSALGPQGVAPFIYFQF